MRQTTPSALGITRKTFLTGAAAGTAALVFRPNLARGQDKPIKIGAQMSLTGGLAPFGIWGSRAAQAAVKKINREGGVKGRKLEYVVEDSETNEETGVLKMRKLLENDEVDFILGDAHSGINIASAPIAREANVVYFPVGAAVETTEDKGNRWVFRGMTNMRIAMKAMVLGALDKLGKRWYTVAADYAWGHSLATEAARWLKEFGGTMVGQKFAPLGTPDFEPYLRGLSPETIDVIVIGFFTRDARTLITQTHKIFGGKLKMIGNVGAVAGTTPKDLGPPAEGLWYVTNYPRRSEYVRRDLKSIDKEYRRLVGIDDEGLGRDGSVSTVSSCYAPWEHVHFIKHGIERSDWKSRKDNLGFIQALEGFRVKASLDFPQGDKVLRAEDHQAFHDQYIERIQDGRVVVKEYVPGQKLLYDPTVDYTKQTV